MELDELLQHEKYIQTAITKKRQNLKIEGLSKIVDIATKLGMSAIELATPSEVSRTPRKRAGKTYRHPTDPSKTWAGTGRKPKWLLEEIANGKSIDVFLAPAA